MSFLFRKPVELPTADTALPGREAAMPVVARHLVLDTPIVPPFPEGIERIVVGMGCFWGAERYFGFVSPEEAREKRPEQVLCHGVSWFGSRLIDRADSRGAPRASRKVNVAQVACGGGGT